MHDPLGDLVQITGPQGNYVVQGFDAIGQLLQQVFYASNGVALSTNRFAYEPGGQVSSATNALGGGHRQALRLARPAKISAEPQCLRPTPGVTTFPVV